jgi:sugar/nucleoside kinase (ribokinase family)
VTGRQRTIGGDTLLAMLHREGVDVGGLVRTTAGQTSASVIPVRPNGDRPAWHCVGANAAFSLEDLDLDEVIRSSHLHLGGPEFLGGPAASELLQYAKANGLSTSVDILADGDPGLLQWIADACRTPTTCCPTTSRCWVSPGPLTF